MKKAKLTTAGMAAALMLNGCASTPLGPTVQALPPPNKPFEVFEADNAACKDYARQAVAGQAESANDRAVGATLLGAALGAGLGAAAGGGRGAGIGAAAGGTVGTAVGANQSEHTQYSIQGQYNNAYAQCMTAKGDQVQQTIRTVTVVHPVYAPPTVVYTPPPTVVYTSPPGYAPPPGAVPAPPPGSYAPPAGGYAPPAGAVPAPSPGGAPPAYAPPAGAVAPPANLPPPGGGPQ